MKQIYLLLLIILLVVITVGLIINKFYSDNTKLSNSELIESTDFPYNLQESVKKIKLPLELQEVSALSYVSNEYLACLYDEKGDIFIANSRSDSIEQKFSITGMGDFEGIEIINNLAYMLEARGMLIEVADYTKETRTIKIHKTELSSKNDCEGLAYDSITNKLLIACKSNAKLRDSKKQYKAKRAVYEFDILTKKLNTEPRFIISLDEIEKITGKTNFMPSGIAVHPITNNIYIVASVGKLLIVLNRVGAIINFAQLDPEIFRQPEGICFSPDGEKLFISNEGQNKKGNILIFDKFEN